MESGGGSIITITTTGTYSTSFKTSTYNTGTRMLHLVSTYASVYVYGSESGMTIATINVTPSSSIKTIDSFDGTYAGSGTLRITPTGYLTLSNSYGSPQYINIPSKSWDILLS